MSTLTLTLDLGPDITIDPRDILEVTLSGYQGHGEAVIWLPGTTRTEAAVPLRHVTDSAPYRIGVRARLRLDLDGDRRPVGDDQPPTGSVLDIGGSQLPAGPGLRSQDPDRVVGLVLTSPEPHDVTHHDLPSSTGVGATDDRAGQPPHAPGTVGAARAVNGATVRCLREAVGVRHGVFAERVGISAGYLTHIEQGAKQPSPHVAVRIAAELAVPLDAITYPATCDEAGAA